MHLGSLSAFREHLLQSGGAGYPNSSVRLGTGWFSAVAAEVGPGVESVGISLPCQVMQVDICL
jgi:hypothetical protein